MKRDLRRKEVNLESVKEGFPPLTAQKEEFEKDMKIKQDESKRQLVLVDELQNEVDVFIGWFLKQEQIEKEKKDEYEVLNAADKEMRKDLQNLRKQN